MLLGSDGVEMGESKMRSCWEWKRRAKPAIYSEERDTKKIRSEKRVNPAAEGGQKSTAMAATFLSSICVYSS